MDVDDDDNDSMSTDQKAENLAKLRQAIEDMETKKEEDDFEDAWYATHVEFFWEIRKHFPDFTSIVNPLDSKEVDQAKIMAEESASQVEYELESGYNLDLPAFWRFCMAVEAIYQGTTLEADTGLEDMMMAVTIPMTIQ